MSAQQSEVQVDGNGTAPDPQLVRRATQLCRGAEPHTDAWPCAAHLAEAHRQLLGLTG